MSADDPVMLFEQATARAATVMAGVSADQLHEPTPCADWDVQQLIDHMVGGTDYLLAALAGEAPPERSGRDGRRLRARARASCASGCGRREVWTGRACRRSASSGRSHRPSPGRSWTTLIHTWDLATATGQDAALDPELVDACIAMFLPDMPERGRASGLVGPGGHGRRRRAGTGSVAGRDGPPAVTDPTIRRVAAGDRPPRPADDAATGLGRRTAGDRTRRRRRAVEVGGEPAPQAAARRRAGDGAGRRQPPPLPGRPATGRARSPRSSTSSGPHRCSGCEATAESMAAQRARRGRKRSAS